MAHVCAYICMYMCMLFPITVWYMWFMFLTCLRISVGSLLPSMVVLEEGPSLNFHCHLYSVPVEKLEIGRRGGEGRKGKEARSKRKR